MKRLKHWLEGGATALLSWMLAGTLILGVPVPAKAISSPAEAFVQWEMLHKDRGHYIVFERAFCSGRRLGEGRTALSAYRDAGGSAAGSYTQDDICRDTRGGWDDLETKAMNDWQACRTWVDLNVRSAPGFDINTVDGPPDWPIVAGEYDPFEEDLGMMLVIFGAIIAAAMMIFGGREESKDIVCGTSVMG